jgi:hypothetical protein
MKRLLLITAISISVSAFAQHPTDKGWRSVGGTGNLHIDLDGTDGTDHTFGLAPEFYWFVGNSFGLGADFGFNMNSHKREQGDSLTTRNQTISGWIAPGFHFYFRDPEKAWRPYAFANVGYRYTGHHYSTRTSSGTTKGSSSTRGLMAYAGAGLAWFFSDHAAFDMRMRVLDVAPYRDYQNSLKTNLSFSPTFSFGIQAFFD